MLAIEGTFIVGSVFYQTELNAAALFVLSTVLAVRLSKPQNACCGSPFNLDMKRFTHYLIYKLLCIQMYGFDLPSCTGRLIARSIR